MTNKTLLFITIVVLVLMLFADSVSAQSDRKQITYQQLYWLGYNNKLILNKDWSIETEIDVRRYLSADRQDQWVLPRIHLHKKIFSGWEAAAGFAYILYYEPQDVHKPVLYVKPEWRLHQQLDFKQSISKLDINHRYRLEERFIHKTKSDGLSDGYNFNLRFRYRLLLAYPLIKSEERKDILIIKVYDEIMLNLGSQIVINIFDQNRIGFALCYGIQKNIQIQLDLFNWLQQRNSGDDYFSKNILRFTIYHTVEL